MLLARPPVQTPFRDYTGSSYLLIYGKENDGTASLELER